MRRTARLQPGSSRASTRRRRRGGYPRSPPTSLLPHPGSFEGFLVIPEELQHYHLALSEGHDRGGSLISLDARLNARQVHSLSHDHDGPGVDCLLDHSLLAHSLRPAVNEGAGCGLPEVDALRPTLGHSEDNVAGHPLRKRVGIAPVPLLQRLAHDLGVLLRHRPRSISRETAAFHAKQYSWRP